MRTIAYQALELVNKRADSCIKALETSAQTRDEQALAYWTKELRKASNKRFKIYTRFLTIQ